MHDDLALGSANDRLKSHSAETLYVALIGATLVHLLVFVYFPEMTAPDWASPDPPLTEVLRLDEFPIPVAPEPIARPAFPAISETAAPDATLPTVGFDEIVDQPPPPPAPDVVDTGPRGGFEVFTVAPRLVDPDGFQRALERVYPGALRDAGIGGTVELVLHIDEEGRVVSSALGTSSGYDALDAAALGLSDSMRFTPALNRDRRVAVVVAVPVTFRVRR